MSSTYIDVPVTTDPDVLAQVAIQFLQNVFPGWVPADGNLDSWLISAVARMAAIDATQASTVPASLFRYLGPLFGIEPLDATAASVTATFTMVDNAGYTIPAGTVVAINAAGDVTAQFAVAANVVVPPGSTVTATGGVTLIALVPGAAGSGLGGVGVPAQLVTTVSFITTVVLAGVTTSGVDAETDAAFLNRLAAELRLQTPRPIVPSDFAALALNVAGVARALAIDLYQPAVNEVQTVSVNATGGTYTLTFGANTTAAIAWNASAATVQAALVLLASVGAGGVTCTGGPGGTAPITVTFIGAHAGTNVAAMTANSGSLTGGTATATIATVTNGAAAVTNQERTVTVALADSSGNAVSDAVAAAVDASLQALREVNFIVNVIAPTFNSIDVSFQISTFAGFDPTTTVANAAAAVASFLSPANWGNPGTGAGAPGGWTDNEKVRFTDLATVIKNVPGVFAIEALTLAAHGGSLATADVTLTGPAPLTTAGTITGTHT